MKPLTTKSGRPIATMLGLIGKNTEGRMFTVVEGQKAGSTTSGFSLGLPPSKFSVVNATPLQAYGLIKAVLSDESSATIEILVKPTIRIREIDAPTPSATKTAMTFTQKRAVADQIAGFRYHDYIGSDPEMFVVDVKDSLIPAFKFLQSKVQNGSLYWDGYQAEFTVSPETCMDASIYSVGDAIHNLATAAKKAGGKLTLKNTIDIPAENLKNDEDKFVNFGCTPSMSAYGEKVVTDIPARLVPYRSAGGHLHFSLSQDLKQRVVAIVKELDRVLGVISVSMFAAYDDKRRRVMYGRAGEYRTPPHGLEYRVLSNAWMCHPAIAHTMYELSRVIIGRFLNHKSNPLPQWDVTEDEARSIINNCDVAKAREVLARNADVLDAILLSIYGLNRTSAYSEYKVESTGLPKFRAMVMEGVDKHLKTPFYPSDAWGVVGTANYRRGGGYARNTTAAIVLIASTGSIEK